jgi:hypothetical protein
LVLTKANNLKVADRDREQSFITSQKKKKKPYREIKYEEKEQL